MSSPILFVSHHKGDMQSFIKKSVIFCRSICFGKKTDNCSSFKIYASQISKYIRNKYKKTKMDKTHVYITHSA